MSKILRHSYGLAKKPLTTEEYNRMTREQNQARLDQQGIDISLENVNKIDAQTKHEEFLKQKALQQALESSYLENTSGLLTDAKNSLFKAIICEAFIEALPIDSYYVQEKLSTFTSIMCDHIDENGGYVMLESAIKKHPETTVLRHIKNTCDSIALEASTRILREAKETPELGKTKLFELDENEKTKFDSKKSNLSLSTISKKIHDKVVNVVSTERDLQEKEQQLKADLAEATEDGGVMESLSVLGESKLKTSTLYNAIFFNNYKGAIENSVVREKYIPVPKEHDEDNDEEDDNLVDRMTLTSSDMSSPMASDIDLDLIMLESVLHYTVLETMNTLCLKDFTRSDIEKLTQRMMNQ